MLSLSRSVDRRSTLHLMGGVAALIGTLEVAPAAASSLPEGVSGQALESSSGALITLTRALSAVPRRRSFSTVPFMADHPHLWDHEAVETLLAYKGSRLQVWEVTELAAPWMNLMREAMNGQVFAHGNKDFLAVAAVHGFAHLALFNQAMWEKYSLAASTDGKFSRNDLIVAKAGLSPTDDHQDVDGFYGPANNNIVSLQKRGAVFVACHDSIHAIARGIHAKQGSGSPSADLIAADLTNNLIPDVVLVPSVVAYLVELEHAGFTYVKGA